MDPMQEMFDSDDVDMFEKSCDFTWEKRLAMAEGIKPYINVRPVNAKDERASHDLLQHMDYSYYKELTDTSADVGMQALSEKLSTLSDRMGFSDEARQMNIETYKVMTVLRYLIYTLSGQIHDAGRFVGSKAEGTDTLGLCSDLDVLLFNPLIELFKLNQNIETNLPYLRMAEDKRTPAGYIKLQLFHNGHAVNEDYAKCYETFFDHKLIIDGDRIFLSNEFTDELTQFHKRQGHENHGPAITHSQSKHYASIDNVSAYVCEELPDAVIPWFRRKRRYGWPSEHTVKLFKNMGCVVVAIGHKNSPEQNLQWRLSFTNQEMYLMQNLNITQYKCYVILKHLKTTLIKPLLSDSLCTYHLKTVLFYTIENSSPSIWQPKYLAYAVLKCLHTFKEWVAEMNCPNYFIPQENMFETKLDHKAQDILILFLSLQFNYQLNLRVLVHMFDFNAPRQSDLLLRCSNIRMEYLQEIFPSFVHSMEKKGYPLNVETMDSIIHHLSFVTDDNTSALCPRLSGHTAFPELLLVCFFVRFTACQTMDKKAYLQQVFGKSPTFEDIYPILINSSAVCSAFCQIRKLLHSKQVSYVLLNCRESTELAQGKLHEFVDQHIEQAGTAQLFNIRMKQASLLYTRDKYMSANKTLYKSIIEGEISSKLLIACSHTNILNYRTINNEAHSFLHKQFNKVLQKLKPDQLTVDYLINITPTCLQFDSIETLMAPGPLQYETLKAFGTPIFPLLCEEAKYIVIDPIIFLYFLLYKNNEAMADRPRKSTALCHLENTILDSLQEPKLWHSDTALNSLGHIYMTKCWNKLAISCFRRSLKKLSLFNSAKWHIMFLLFG